MADAVLYDDYLKSLLDRANYSFDKVQEAKAVITHEKEALLSKNDILLAQLDHSLAEAEALMDKAGRVCATAEAKAAEASNAICPLPPQPSPPTDEQKKQHPGLEAEYEAKCIEYEEILQRNNANELRAKKMCEASGKARECVEWLDRKRALLQQLLADVQNVKEEFPRDLTYLSKTNDRLENFSHAMLASMKAADEVLGCTCDRLYNSFLKFDVPLPFDTAKIGSRFPVIQGSPAFLEYLSPAPMPTFRGYEKTDTQNRLTDANDATEITVTAGTTTQFLYVVDGHPKARTVYSTQFCIRCCGKGSLINQMERRGFTFTDDPTRPKFEK